MTHFVEFESARVLVADDDPILREFAMVHLATPTVEVEVAEDGLVALERLNQGGIDIALVDLDMPRLDGFELIERIRWDEQLKHLPIVVVTGREDMVAVDRAFALGATSFVVKPLNWRLLSHQLAYVLRNARAEGQVRGQLEALKKVNELKDRILRLSRQKITGPLNDILESAQVIETHSALPQISESLNRIAAASMALTRVHADMGEAEKLTPNH
ncbi:response regulator [Asticcacaulis taihuensis]|uniref:Response regulator receiver domain-containing protein n=1 Tax=Asticcacaulis taihuensis TaxID=260084 RepID=A0A1G4SUB2_9CAUL|nr:response regulator [Asticcacaulis taihuensis]SCW72750.1 Response regulator receiver domain-containing protein [Asticcacaulis taihuensis]